MDGFLEKVCVTCRKNEDEITLKKCPVCFRYYCDDDAFLMAGREFCSKNCARYNFFPDEES